MIEKIKNYFIPKKKEKEAAHEYTYFDMISFLKLHYKYEMNITGQINENTMNRRLSDMSFGEIKELFEYVLKVEKESSSLNQ